MKYVKAYLLVFAASLLVTLGVYALYPDYRALLRQEDSLIENLSAFFYFSAFVLGLGLFIRHRPRHAGLLILAAIGLLGFLDELSFGERLLGFEPPRFMGKDIDGAHDFFEVGYRVGLDALSRFPVAGGTVLVLAGVAVGGMLSKHRAALARTTASVRHKPAVILAAFFPALLLTAMVLDLDLDLVRHPILQVSEELLEMNAALALLFCCVSLAGSNAQAGQDEPPNAPTGPRVTA